MSKPQLKLASKPAKPREWPFMSPLGAEELRDIDPQDEPTQNKPERPYCECLWDLTATDLQRGLCGACGKSIFL